MKVKKTALAISITLFATAISGCDIGKEQITATTKDIPVYNEEGSSVVAVPQKEATQTLDMSEYVKKSDVQDMIDMIRIRSYTESIRT